MSGTGTYCAAAALALALLGGAAAEADAGGLTCVANIQCRGDAERMCAPSGLRIEAARRGGRVDMWIDGQGPYVARVSGAMASLRLEVPLFAGHALSVAPDGRFVWLGNRGKRFSGQCEGAL